MPKLVIDNREVEVAQGVKVLEAAQRLGIYIPRFCYHPALGSVGACRVCAVMFLDGPIKGLEMSCMADAADGMVVSTDHPEAQAFRRHVIEWLMQNHPHDCPVCDEGGHCLLQDLTISGGHAHRRYRGLKLTYRDQELGPLVRHEMNRCIHCWRCRRFYQDFAGGRDLGALQIARRTYFGRQCDGTLESPFAGNLVDLCPTGVFTDKPSRFQGRRWDFQRGPTICGHCSLGCHQTANTRYRALVRIEARHEPEINGHFICDRGRYGGLAANLPQRPRQARVDGQPVVWSQALAEAAQRLAEVAHRHGPQAVAVWSSTRTSLETMAALDRLSAELGWRPPRFFPDAPAAARAREALAARDQATAMSLAQLEECDCLLLLGADPLNEAPMLALTLRQAATRGALVGALDPRALELPLDFTQVAMPPGLVAPTAGWLVAAALERQGFAPGDDASARLLESLRGYEPPAEAVQALEPLVAALAACRRPALIAGASVVPPELPALAGDLARLLAQAKDRAGFFPLLEGANAFGAALTTPDEAGEPDLLTLMEERQVRGLLLVEGDPLATHPHRQRVELALDKLDTLVALDHLPGPAMTRAVVALPTCTRLENQGGSLVNQEGRWQDAPAVHRAGTPLAQVNAGDHPPRVYVREIPGGDIRPAPVALAELTRALGGPAEPTETLEQWLSRRGWRVEPTPGGGRVLWPRRPRRHPLGEAPGPGPVADGDHLELLLVERVFDGEEQGAWSPPLAARAPEPKVSLHPGDAAALGLDQARELSLRLPAGTLDIGLELAPTQARGTLCLPRALGVDWQRIKERSAFLPRTHLAPKGGSR